MHLRQMVCPHDSTRGSVYTPVQIGHSVNSSNCFAVAIFVHSLNTAIVLGSTHQARQKVINRPRRLMAKYSSWKILRASSDYFTFNIKRVNIATYNNKCSVYTVFVSKGQQYSTYVNVQQEKKYIMLVSYTDDLPEFIRANRHHTDCRHGIAPVIGNCRIILSA